MATQDRATFEPVGLNRIMNGLARASTIIKGGEGMGFYTKAISYVYRFVLKNFQSQGQQVGGWAPLADSTMAWKEKHGYSMILQNVGNLKNNWRPIIGPSSGILRSATNYGIYHDSDQPRKQKRGGGDRLPRRRILPTSDEMKAPFRKILEFEITNAYNRCFR